MSKIDRSIGVMVFGFLIITTCILSILPLLNPKHLFAAYIKPFGMILYITAIAVTVFEIILGFNILKLNEWARKYLIILNIFYLVSIFVVPVFEDKNYNLSLEQSLGRGYKRGQQQLTLEEKRRAEEYNIKMEEKIKRYPPEQQERTRQVQAEVQANLPKIMDKIVKLFFNGLFFLWYVLIIFFFTRPKVKEQFK